MYKIITLLFFMIPVIAGSAEKGMKVSDLSLDRCELREVTARMWFESTGRAAAIADQSLPLLKELEVITSKATVPNKPIKDQLSSDDVAKFSELSQRLKSTQLSQLIESKRKRDLRVIERMVMIADRDYRWQEQPEEKDPDFIINSAIQLLRFTVKDVSVTSPTSPVCSLEFALHAFETEAIDKMISGKAQFETALMQFESILLKYEMETLDLSRLSNKDLVILKDLMDEVISPMQRHRNLIKDVENIKLMARASNILYESNKQDIAFSGGDILALGATVQRRKKNNEFTENMQIAFGIWTAINEKIPADYVNKLGNLQ